MTPRPLAVVFDMDGLLFDSETLYRDAILHAARDLGHDFTADDFLELVGRPWALNRAVLQARIGADGDLLRFRQGWLDRYDVLKPTLALKPGAVELLDRLDELGIRRAICTSSSHDDVDHNLRLHGLSGRFDAVIAAGDYGHGKPAPDPYLKAAETLGIPPAACLALEDSHNGIRSAAAAGMRAIMVPDLLPATEEIRLLCHRVVADLHDVRALIDPVAS